MTEIELIDLNNIDTKQFIDLYNKEIERISKNTDIQNYLSLLDEDEISATRIQMLFHYSFPKAKEFLEN